MANSVTDYEEVISCLICSDGYDDTFRIPFFKLGTRFLFYP